MTTATGDPDPIRHICLSELRLTVDVSPTPTLLAAQDGRIRTINRLAENLFGYAPDALLGKPVEALVPEPYRNGHPTRRERFFTDPKSRPMGRLQDLQGRRQDGSLFPLEIGLNPFQTEEGPMVLASIIDLTDQRKHDERFRLAVEAAPNAMVMVDVSGHIVLVNKKTEQDFGYTSAELIGSHVEVLIPKRFRTAHGLFRQRFMERATPRAMGVGRDLFGERKDGTEFPVEVGLMPIRHGPELYIMSAIVDVTARQQAVQEIERANLELRSKNEQLEQFVYTVSHDLKSPLVTATTLTGLLREDLEAGDIPQVSHALGRLDDALAQMTSLINDLLQFSRTSHLRLECEQVDLAQLVHQVASNLGARLNARQATLHIKPGLPVIRGDRDRLIQVFDNLFTNAIKYGCPSDGCTITVGAEPHSDEIRCYVQDQGAGIPFEYQNKVFGLFERLESHESGTGVGLAIVAKVMELHGGRVWVSPAPAGGAIFWLAFPNSPIQLE